MRSEDLFDIKSVVLRKLQKFFFLVNNNFDYFVLLLVIKYNIINKFVLLLTCYYCEYLRVVAHQRPLE